MIVLDGDKPPVRSIETNSAPSSDEEVNFLVTVVGALILTVVLLLPSTIKPSLILTLSKITSSLQLAESPSAPDPVVVVRSIADPVVMLKSPVIDPAETVVIAVSIAAVMVKS